MGEREHKNWRELCTAALEAEDPRELLTILHELNKALKHEGQVRRDLREAMRGNKSSGEIRRWETLRIENSGDAVTLQRICWITAAVTSQ
jgi:hypothetical protein